MPFQFQFDPVIAEWRMIAAGVLLTIQLSVAAILLGFGVAVLMSAARSMGPRWLRVAVDAYVELLRNTPFLVQLFMVFFGLPELGIRLSAAQAALLAMTLNLSAYATEIIRAGVESIHHSQVEAGHALALTSRQVFQHVILIPAVAKVWPALSSQFVLMLLASSVTSFISVQELSGTAAVIESRSFRSFESYIVATVIYLGLALCLKSILYGVGRFAFPRVSGLARVQAKGESA
ncbi:MAG TPA: amino acid ABC transporter permease [Beijerinckiaceae bacterium]|jgi:polar amino acid transport system permease protein